MSGVSRWRESGHLERAVQTAGGWPLAAEPRTDDGQLNLPRGGHGELPDRGQRDYFA